MKKLFILIFILSCSVFFNNSIKLKFNNLVHITYYQGAVDETSFESKYLNMNFPMNVDAVRIDCSKNELNNILNQLDVTKLWGEFVDNINIYYYNSDKCDRYAKINNYKISVMIAIKENTCIIGFPIIYGSY